MQDKNMKVWKTKLNKVCTVHTEVTHTRTHTPLHTHAPVLHSTIKSEKHVGPEHWDLCFLKGTQLLWLLGESMQTFPRSQHLLNRAIQVTGLFLGYGQYKHGISFILHAALAEDF